MAGPIISRAALAKNDVEFLMLQPQFKRFLSTVRMTAGIETVAYGPDDRHLHFAEGRRSLWCDILRTVEQSSDEALLLILSEEMKASRETNNGRRKYDRLGTDDDGNPGGRRDAGDGLVYLDYGDDGDPDA